MRAGLPALLGDPARLEALHRLRLLDPDAAGTFERAGRLAARLLQVPIAGVNFVDADHQFWPGVRLPENSPSYPSHQGFCPVTLSLGRPMFVTDARTVPEFAADPLIQRYGLVAYAGVPLYSAGQPVGTLCAVHTEPVEWSEEQRTSLGDLAGLVMDELELRAQIAERRRAEQRAERARAEAANQARLLAAVMRQMPEGLVVARAPDGELTAANDEFRRILGQQMLAAATIEEYGNYPAIRPDGKPYQPHETPLARALLAGETVSSEELRLRRPDGVLVDLWARAAPVRDDQDQIVAAVGIFTDITERKQLERSLRISQSRFEFLAEASVLVASSLEPQVIINRLSRLVVERLADWCAVVEPDPQGRLRRVSAVHRDPARRELAERWLSHGPLDPTGNSALATVYRERRSIRLVDPRTAELAGEFAAIPGYAEMLAGLGRQSTVVAPMVAAGEGIGAIAFSRDRHRPVFNDEEAALATELAARFAIALAHARRFEAEHSAAEVLQRSLLPRLTDLPNLDVAAVYVPSGSTLTVGGDFYDVLDLDGRHAGLAVGDVMGHGVRAAAVMGQLRAALRAYARLGLPPGQALSTLDGLVADFPGGMLVTCLYGIYDVPAGLLRMASAGHLAPRLRLPSGEVRVLDVPPGPPLGAGQAPYRETVHEVPPGALLALFSDGLVEDRDRDLDTGLAALADALTEFGAGPLPVAGDAVLRALGRRSRNDDDVALLLVRSRPIPLISPPAPPCRS